ncbi:MAG: hypothetical protein ABI831_09560 [Betaproteobacteria bacterium]
MSESPGGQLLAFDTDDSPLRRTWLTEGWGYGALHDSGRPNDSGSQDYFQYEKIPIPPPEDFRDADALPAAPEHIFSCVRRRPVREALLEATTRWLAEIPEARHPHELANSFPRIANRLCLLRNHPEDFKAYVNSLLLDTRDGRRQGFPTRIAAELAALIDDTDRPTTVTTVPGWSHVRARRE